MFHKLWSKIKNSLLNILGDLKYYKWPMFIVYDPSEYAIDGEKSREIMKVVRTGDLLLRRYNHYLDGCFIPGKYSHTGIYVGDGKMIHAVAEGVSYCDILEFLRCDGICILRPTCGQRAAVELAKKCVTDGIPYDFDFKEGNKALYCHELGAVCYSNLRIEKKVPKLFKGLIHSTVTRWLAESFLTSPDFKVVGEY